MPARRSVLESSAYEQQVGAEVAAADRAALQGVLQYWPSGSSAPDDLAWTVLQEAVLDVYAGRATAQEALTLAQQEAGSDAAQ